MKGIKIGFLLLFVGLLSNCRTHCGCPMAQQEQTEDARNHDLVKRKSTQEDLRRVENFAGPKKAD